MFIRFDATVSLAIPCASVHALPKSAHRRSTAGLFSEYALDHCYDEMFDASGVPRPPYEALYRRLLELSSADLRQRQQDADSAFLHQGVTFTVYGDDQGTERIFPYDLLPRIITAREWETIERGPDSARDRAEPVSQGHLPGRPDPEGRHRPAPSRLQRATLPPRDGGHPPAPRHLRVGGGHRSGAAARRAVRRARRQPARAERRVVHADQPPDHQARLSRAVHELRRPADRSLRPGAAGHAALACARRSVRTRRSCC